MRTPPKHLKPTKRNQRKMEKAIEAAKKAKAKEAALIEKYERQIAKDWEKNNRTQQKMFGGNQPTAAAAPAEKPVAPAAAPQKPAKSVPAPAPVPVYENENEDETETKRKGGIFFTIAGIVFLLIAVITTLLWKFGLLDKWIRNPVAAPETPAASVSAPAKP